MRAGIYARVSTLEQDCDNQLLELRRYVEARGWTGVEYVDRGVSGTKDRRPALDTMLKDAKRRKFDVLVCWRLDRLGRNLKHLITLLDELQALGVPFVSLAGSVIAAEESSASTVSTRARGFTALQDMDDRRLLAVIIQAVARLEDDVIASLLHQRRFLERVVHLAAQHCGLDLSFAADAVGRIKALESHLRLNYHVVGSMHWLRLRGNEAAHSFDTTFDSGVARDGLRHCYNVARWFVGHLGYGDLEQFALEVVPVNTPTERQLRREEAQRRKIESLDRVVRQQKALLEQRSGGTPPTTVRETVPDLERLRWVYFATPTKANRSDTYELAYSRGVVCCDAKTVAGSLKPNVKRLRPGDLMLLAYGKDGEYEPQLYLTVEPPTKKPIADTDVLHELPKELAPILEGAGYSPDPSLGVFTGFRVTPCSDWKGQIPERLRKPIGQNFLRAWEEVRVQNGWLTT